MANFEQAIDDRAESFLQVGDVARLVAEKHCGVTVDDVTHRRWRELLGLLREVDTLADDSPVGAEEVLARLEDFSEFTDRYPTLSPGEVSDETRDVLLSRTRRILKLGRFISEAESPARLAALRITEGRQTANFLSDVATPFVAEQPDFEGKYMPVMRSMAVTANLLDSIIDARMDVQDGKLNQAPNLEYYGVLAKNTLAQSRLASRALLHVPVMREFAVMSWNRLQNRVRRGRSETSSLGIFGYKK